MVRDVKLKTSYVIHLSGELTPIYMIFGKLLSSEECNVLLYFLDEYSAACPQKQFKYVDNQKQEKNFIVKKAVYWIWKYDQIVSTIAQLLVRLFIAVNVNHVLW